MLNGKHDHKLDETIVNLETALQPALFDLSGVVINAAEALNAWTAKLVSMKPKVD